MTISLFSIGTFFFLQSQNAKVVESLGWLPLTSLCVYILAYPVGYGEKLFFLGIETET